MVLLHCKVISKMPIIHKKNATFFSTLTMKSRNAYLPVDSRSDAQQEIDKRHSTPVKPPVDSRPCPVVLPSQDHESKPSPEISPALVDHISFSRGAETLKPTPSSLNRNYTLVADPINAKFSLAALLQHCCSTN